MGEFVGAKGQQERLVRCQSRSCECLSQVERGRGVTMGQGSSQHWKGLSCCETQDFPQYSC